MTAELTGTAAWDALLSGDHTRWSGIAGQLKSGMASVAFRPKFTIETDSKIFCIGSCFARNVEEYLIYQNIDVQSKRIVSPLAEFADRPVGLVNKFTTHSIVNELEWASSSARPDATWFEETPQGVMDLQLSPGARPVPLQRAIERRLYLTSDYFSRIRHCNVVILTLGLNEVWFDREIGRYLNAAPSRAGVRRHTERYRLHISDYADNLEALRKLHALLMVLSPKVKTIVTVSPVPMSETFSGTDIVVANSYSKSVLRAAAQQFASENDNVEYFPSYDMVAMSERSRAYRDDCLHVTKAMISEIVRLFLTSFMLIDFVDIGFHDMAYLDANPDVEAAVRRGEFHSGYEHWRLHGAAEGRPLRSAVSNGRIPAN